MIRVIDWKQTRETKIQQAISGRYHPARIASFRDGNKRRHITLRAGDGDTVAIYRSHGAVYIVTIRRALSYCGVECYVSGASIGEIFFQRDYEVAALLGRNERDYAAIDRLSDRAIAARLIAHIDEAIC